jgi:acetoin utilization deacetylase AcuC-like enzyme
LVLFSKEQLPIIDSLPKAPQKCSTIQTLLEAYGLLDKVETIVPAMASAKDLHSFHSEEFIEALRVSSLLSGSGNVGSSVGSLGPGFGSGGSYGTGSLGSNSNGQDHTSSDTESVELEEDLEIYGLKDDCSPFPQLWQYSRLTAGATILAARYLIECDRQNSPSSSPRSDMSTYNRLQSSSSQSSLLNHRPLMASGEQEGSISSYQPQQQQSSSSLTSSSTSSSSTPTNIDSPNNGSSSHTPTTPTQTLHTTQSRESIGSAAPQTLSPQNLPNTNSRSPPGSLGTLPAPVAIHWMGGRHHAKREEASGLCFVNDAVLGLLQLVNHFERVLYIDIDVHHGDGTEEAFKYSKQVLTLSCHLHDPGTFYPGSGAIDEIGEGKAKYYTINVPFKEGIIDGPYTKLFDTIIGEAVGIYQPQAVVLVCGADCLVGDPLGGFNLSLRGVEHCIKTLLALNLPLLILGGGGYHLQNVSRLAAVVTAACLSVQLPDKIPQQISSFSDSSTYYTPEMLKQNRNTEEYLKMLEATVLDNLQMIKPTRD